MAATVADEVLMVRTAKLKPHPLHDKIYGKPQVAPDFEALRDSIKERGVMVPLIITRDNIVISGRTRLFFATQQHIDEVPCQVFASTDPLEIETALIHANRQREKTSEQKAREFKHLKRIEEERAKQRQEEAAIKGNKARAGIPVKENFPEPAGQSRDLAAEQVGWSGRTAEKAAVVVEAIDEAEEEGDTEAAEELRETLNTKSVDAAFRKATGKPTPKPEPKTEPFLTREEEGHLDRLRILWDSATPEVRKAFRLYVG